jgi:uncharacterized protein YjbI with pentapeptide repeats
MNQALEHHQLWLRSNGKKGIRFTIPPLNELQGGRVLADLSGANLERANLRKAVFRELDLSGICLRGADLEECEFSDCRLDGADLHSAELRHATFGPNTDLSGADLRDADLRDATFDRVSGFSADQLGGADICGASLPDTIDHGRMLDTVNDLIRNAGKQVSACLLFCLFVWVAVGSTTDAMILGNSNSFPLPVINTTIGLVAFYWAVPVALIGLFLHYHLYLQHLWRALAAMPAVLVDGTHLDSCTHPWLPTSLVRTYFPSLGKKHEPLQFANRFVSLGLLWLVVPLTMIGLWIRYWPAHDWFITKLHITVIALALGAGLLLYSLMTDTFRGRLTKSPLWSATGWGALMRSVAFLGVALPVYLGLGHFSWRVMTGRPSDGKPGLVFFAALRCSPHTWDKVLVGRLGWRCSPDITNADICTKPTGWNGSDVSLVRSAFLENRDLSFICGAGAFLAKAKLSGSRLAYGDFSGADLRKADLRKADLRYVRLETADLRQADLESAYLRGAALSGCRMNGASAPGADFSYCCFDKASFTGAFLLVANFSDAYIDRSSFARANLSGARMAHAFLNRTTLRGAILARTDFSGASFASCDLRGVNLSEAIGLTRAQLSRTCKIDRTTRLPAYLRRIDRGEGRQPQDCGKMEHQ